MKIFIDTAPFIYLIENHPVFASQLALSINEKCGRFITNDKKLKKVTEIKVDTMDDL